MQYRSSILLLASLSALVGCRSAPVTEFALTAEPAGATYQSSWGASGALPETLQPPVSVGRQWVVVSAANHHSQELRFEYRDRERREPFTASEQRLFGLDTEFAPPEQQSDLDRDLTLDFSHVHVLLVPADADRVFSVDLDSGIPSARVTID